MPPATTIWQSNSRTGPRTQTTTMTLRSSRQSFSNANPAYRRSSAFSRKGVKTANRERKTEEAAKWKGALATWERALVKERDMWRNRTSYPTHTASRTSTTLFQHFRTHRFISSHLGLKFVHVGFLGHPQDYEHSYVHCSATSPVLVLIGIYRKHCGFGVVDPDGHMGQHHIQHVGHMGLCGRRAVLVQQGQCLA